MTAPLPPLPDEVESALLDATSLSCEPDRNDLRLAIRRALLEERKRAAEECAKLCDQTQRKLAILRSLDATHKARGAGELAAAIRAHFEEP